MTENGRYRPEIDGLRFAAVIPVVIYHAVQRLERAFPEAIGAYAKGLRYIPQAWTGVALFFVISGYVISSQFFSRAARGTGFSLWHYISRRISRIEPPYIIILTVTFAVISVTGYVPSNTTKFWSAPDSLTESYFSSLAYLHGSLFNTMPRLFPPGWSLEVEAQFYLLAPLVLLLLLRLRNTWLRLSAISALLIGLLLLSVGLDDSVGIEGWHRYTVLRWGFYFAAGIGVACAEASLKVRRLSPRVCDAIGFLSLAGFAASGVASQGYWPLDAVTTNLLRVLVMLGLFVGALAGSAFKRMAGLAWIALIGSACYSIYLTHVQVLQLSTTLLAHVWHHPPALAVTAEFLFIQMPIVIAAGLLAYAIIERPFMTPHWPSRLPGLVRGALRRVGGARLAGRSA